MADQYTVGQKTDSTFYWFVIDGGTGFMLMGGTESDAHYYAREFNAFESGLDNGYDPRKWQWDHEDGSVARRPVADDDLDEEDYCECEECTHARGECDYDCSICDDE